MNLVADERPGGIVVVSWAEPSTPNAPNVVEVRQRVGEIELDHPRMAFGMSHVGFADSFTIGVLVGPMRKARTTGGVKLAALTLDIETIFELTHLQRMSRVHDSMDGAIQELVGATAQHRRARGRSARCLPGRRRPGVADTIRAVVRTGGRTYYSASRCDRQGASPGRPDRR